MNWSEGGQSTNVELWSERILFGRDPRPSDADLRSGGPGLTGVLNRALLDESIEPSAFPLLRFLSPFDNSVYNVAEVRELLQEIERLRGWAVLSDEHEACASLLALAHKCAEMERWAYLVFIGD
jgi:hypothetical protein